MFNKQPYNNEYHFIRELSDRLGLVDKLELENDIFECGIDLAVRNKRTGQLLLIECKDGRQYGELPNSIILQIATLVQRHPEPDKIMLISFSSISDFLSSKLKQLNVYALTKPTVGEAVNQVELALA